MHADFTVPVLKALPMLDLLDDITTWQRCGREVALATLVGVRGSAPRDPGAALAVTNSGELAGSVSGGCVEAALVDEAAEVLRGAPARLVEYGISDADAQAVGLTCGGRLRIFVERLAPDFAAAVSQEGLNDRLLALAVRLNGADAGARLCVFSERTIGTLGNVNLDRAVIAEARATISSTLPETRSYGLDGEPIGEVEIFLQRVASAPNMYVFGAIDFTHAMVHAAKFLGYHVTVCDARPAFATRERFPDADSVAVRWPDDFLRDAPIDERTALIVLTHDEKFDIPLLHAALQSRAGYIGAMGSRKTHERRVEQLREAGLSEEQLARLNAPIGLDIGARTPQETAISICAEVIALKHGRAGGRLTGGAGPVRGTS